MKTITTEFQVYFCKIAKEFTLTGNAGLITDMSAAPSIGVGYGVSFTDKGMYITFNEYVSNGNGNEGRRFIVRPVSGRKPQGEISPMR